jgi:hypothetical protein
VETLEEFYDEVLAQLPVKDEARLVLDGTLCKCPPVDLSTEKLRVVPRPLGHSYGDSARYDIVDFFADKPTYRRLGLLLFSSIFHPNRQITLHLSHPETTATQLKIGCEIADPSQPYFSGLANVPRAYGYEAAPVKHMHPFWGEEWRVLGELKVAGRAGSQLPFLSFTNDDGRSNRMDAATSRYRVEGFGGPEATASLAALLLDIGLPHTELNEMCLESPSGNWSVAFGSSEARFWIGYDFPWHSSSPAP